MNIETLSLSKRFGHHVALQDISLNIDSGALTTLLGPSGCGKTTLLRILAGLEQADHGKVLLGGVDVSNKPAYRRKFGFVFQHYVLFKHMTVFENVAFGLRIIPRASRPSKEEIEARVHEMLGLVQLDNQSRKYPWQMSGGQQQRVALARALVIRPPVLLLDEPFGALDANVRRDLRRWLRRLHDEMHVTSILVTHDQEEALEVSDKVVLMNHGSIAQIGKPEEVYRHPQNPFVYEFLGSVNVFHGRIRDHYLVHYSQDEEKHPIELQENSAAKLYVRPHDVRLLKRKKHKEDVEGIVKRVSFVGPEVRIEVYLQQEQRFIEAVISETEWEQQKFKAGDTVYAHPKNYRLFDDAPASQGSVEQATESED